MRKLIGVLVIALISTTLLAGCNLFKSGDEPAKAPTEVVKEALTKSSAVTSATFDAKLSGKMEDKEETAFKNVEFEGTIGGSFDFKDPKTPKLTLKIDGKGTKDGGEEQSLSAELRLDKENLYALLSKLPDMGEAAPPEMMAMFMGKWWQVPLPAGSFDTLNFPSGSDENLTPEQKKIKELMENTNFFKDLKYEGTEDINGVPSYHYAGTLDKEALKTFATESAKIQGQEMTKEELEEFDKGMATLEMTVDMWIGTTDMVFRKSAGTLTMAPNEMVSVSMEFESVIDKINEPVTVEAPADATLFDLGQFMGVPSTTPVVE